MSKTPTREFYSFPIIVIAPENPNEPQDYFTDYSVFINRCECLYFLNKLKIMAQVITNNNITITSMLKSYLI